AASPRWPSWSASSAPPPAASPSTTTATPPEEEGLTAQAPRAPRPDKKRKKRQKEARQRRGRSHRPCLPCLLTLLVSGLVRSWRSWRLGGSTLPFQLLDQLRHQLGAVLGPEVVDARLGHAQLLHGGDDRRPDALALLALGQVQLPDQVGELLARNRVEVVVV